MENQKISKQSLQVQAIYSQLKESIRGRQSFLLGTPGTISKKVVDASKEEYLYRSFYLGKKRLEEFVCPAADDAKRKQLEAKIQDAREIEKAIKQLRLLGYQVLDKETGNVLANLFNHGLLGNSSNSMVLVGTLAYATLLNELGLIQTAARTLDIDLGYHGKIKLASKNSVSFSDLVKTSNEKFFPVPGMPSSEPSTSLKIPGIEGISIDVLANGKLLGEIVAAPKIGWHAQTVPYLDFLIENQIPAACMAGAHVIPCNVPSPEAFVLHKLFSAYNKNRPRDKKTKDKEQAKSLLRFLMSEEPESFLSFVQTAPTKLQEAFDRHQAEDLIITRGMTALMKQEPS